MGKKKSVTKQKEIHTINESAIKKCEKEYNRFLKDKTIHQHCFKENHEELFQILFEMAKCQDTFVWCNLCKVIYNKQNLHCQH